MTQTFSQEVSSWFHTTEQTVLGFIEKIVTGAEVAESEVQKGLSWIAANTPQIAAGVEQAETLIASIASVTPGVATSSAVQTAINDANKAVDALNAFATANKTGATGATALVTGYVAYQQATAAAASAKAAATSAGA